MKPDLYKMAVRTMERFLVVVIVAPILRWLFTGVVVVPMATIVCVMTAVVLYDVARFFIDTRRHMVEDEKRERAEKAGRARPLAWAAALSAFLLVGWLGVGAFKAGAPSARTTFTTDSGRAVEMTDRRLPMQSVESYVRSHIAAVEAAKKQN